MSTVFTQAFTDLGTRGEHVSPRGSLVLEIQNAVYTFTKPSDVYCCHDFRKLSPTYLKKEFLWYLKGDLTDTSIAEHASMWGGLISPDGILNSNYGYYMFRKKPGILWVMNELVRDPDSRRAVVPILNDSHLKNGVKDVPCTCTIGYRIRNNKLVCTVHMRSADLVFGWGNDAPLFHFFQQMVLHLLRAQPCYENLALGDLTIFADSLHIYERHFHYITKVLDGEYSLLSHKWEVPPIADAAEVNSLLMRRFDTDKRFTKWLLS